jgi:hypothetical protein
LNLEAVSKYVNRWLVEMSAMMPQVNERRTQASWGSLNAHVFRGICSAALLFLIAVTWLVDSASTP